MKKIAVLTSGGDAPGMNAAIRSVVRTAIYYGLEVYGIERGFLGLMNDEILPMDRTSVGNILQRGGTILRTARAEEFKTHEGQKKAVEVISKRGIEGLVVIGGDGSFRGAHVLDSKWGIPTIAVPATIDNDIGGTDYSIGFDTAVNTVINAINNIKDTASSHDRVFIIQVMGRNAGHLALLASLAGGAEVVILPEVEFDINEICKKIVQGKERGKLHSIVLVAEGVGSAYGIGDLIAHKIKYETRIIVLGHLQRGGSPTAFDRILASKMGYAAVLALMEGERDKMVGIVGNKVVLSPIETAWKEKKELDQEIYKINEILAM